MPFRDLSPDEVGELLGAVGMAAGDAEEALEGLVPDPSVRAVEPPLDVGRELVRRDHPDLDPLRAAPERLVLVVEDRLQDVTLAAQVDVGDLGLGLEDRAHQVRKLLVELQHLLKLVEDQRGPLLALGADLAGELEELLDRVVDPGCPGTAGLEAEAQARVVGVDLDRRLDAQAAEERGGLLERLTDGRTRSS